MPVVPTPLSGYRFYLRHVLLHRHVAKRVSISHTSKVQFMLSLRLCICLFLFLSLFICVSVCVSLLLPLYVNEPEAQASERTSSGEILPTNDLFRHASPEFLFVAHWQERYCSKTVPVHNAYCAYRPLSGYWFYLWHVLLQRRVGKRVSISHTDKVQFIRRPRYWEIAFIVYRIFGMSGLMRFSIAEGRG